MRKLVRESWWNEVTVGESILEKRSTFRGRKEVHNGCGCHSGCGSRREQRTTDLCKETTVDELPGS
jgi:hypothetical protein